MKNSKRHTDLYKNPNIYLMRVGKKEKRWGKEGKEKKRERFQRHNRQKFP
jgi:hypothetical protein